MRNRYDTAPSRRAVQARRVGGMMRRFRQLALIHEHFQRVLREGKRELSGQELWRAQQMARALSDSASELRHFRTDPPDVPGVVELK